MQFALPFQLPIPMPASPRTINNRSMSSGDNNEADKKEAQKKLRNKALRLLTTREHSREELLRKLAQSRANVARRNAEEKADKPNKDDIESIVDELAAQGWQSDDRYAEAMVRRLTGQAAKRYIADKLAQAGIKKDVAQLALDALDQDEHETAVALWSRRFGAAPKDEKERQRHIRFLLSRGFGLGDAFKIVPKASEPPTSSFGRRWRGKVERNEE
jgi:regulatory protein